jgi:MFS family permease
LALTVREPPRAPRAVNADTTVPERQHLRRHWKAYVTYALAAGAAVSVLQAVQAWIPTYFIRTFDLPIATVSSAMGVATLVMTPITALTSGWLLDRLEARGVSGAAGRMLAGAFVLVPIPMLVTAFAPNAMVAAIGYFFVKICLGFAVPTLLGGLQVMTPSTSRGTASAFVMMALTLIGVGLGPPAAGALSEYVFSGPRAVGFSILTVTILSGFGAAALMWSNRGRAARAAQDARLEDEASEQLMAAAKA